AVQRLMRHADLRLTTETYGHLAPGYLQGELSKLRLLDEGKTAELVPLAASASATRTAHSRHGTPDDEPPAEAGAVPPGLAGGSEERETGVEPAPLGWGSRCSTTELLPRCDEGGRTTSRARGAIRFPPRARGAKSTDPPTTAPSSGGRPPPPGRGARGGRAGSLPSRGGPPSPGSRSGSARSAPRPRSSPRGRSSSPATPRPAAPEAPRWSPGQSR